MNEFPVSFPTPVERLKRSIDAQRHLSVLEKFQLIDEMNAMVAAMRSSSGDTVDYDRLKRIRKEEVRRIFREFIQQQLARTDSRSIDSSRDDPGRNLSGKKD